MTCPRGERAWPRWRHPQSADSQKQLTDPKKKKLPGRLSTPHTEWTRIPVARSVPATGQLTVAKSSFPCFGRGTYGPRMNNCAFFSFSFVLLIIWERRNPTKLDILHITLVAVGIYTLHRSPQQKPTVNPSTSSSPLMLHSFLAIHTQKKTVTISTV